MTEWQAGVSWNQGGRLGPVALQYLKALERAFFDQQVEIQTLSTALDELEARVVILETP